MAEIYDRVNDIAKGAALMISTQLETRFIKACSNVVPNNVLERLMHKNLSELPLPTYTDEEMAFAKSIRESVENLSNTLESKADKYGIEGKRLAKEHKDDIINNFVVPYVPDDTAMPGSTDVGRRQLGLPHRTGQHRHLGLRYPWTLLAGCCPGQVGDRP